MLTCHFNKVALPSPATHSRALHVNVNDVSNTTQRWECLQGIQFSHAQGSAPAGSFKIASSWEAREDQAPLSTATTQLMLSSKGRTTEFLQWGLPSSGQLENIFKTWRPKDESVGFSGWNPHACWRVNDPRSENTGTIFRDTVEKPPGKVLNQALWPLKAPGTSRVGGNDNLPGSNWSKSPCWCPPESELLQWSAISATNSLGGFQDSL